MELSDALSCAALGYPGYAHAQWITFHGVQNEGKEAGKLGFGVGFTWSPTDRGCSGLRCMISLGVTSSLMCIYMCLHCSTGHGVSFKVVWS